MKWDYRQSVKEVARHIGFKTGATYLLTGVRRMRGLITAHLNGATPAERFREIYRLGAWVHTDDQCASSGLGSEINATVKAREALPPLLVRLGCRQLLDVGCGDWNWMHDVRLPCDYLGVDIVPEVIETNRCRYERPGVAFTVVDAIAGPLPNADVILCREVLFHLSFHDGLAVLANVRQATNWLIATTDTAILFNSDIATGDYRKINLQRSPYRLPPPRETIADAAVSRGRVLGLWATADLHYVQR